MHWHGDCFAPHGQPNGTQLEVLDLAYCVSAHHVDDGVVDDLGGLMAGGLAFTIGLCVPMSALSLIRCLDSSPTCGLRSVRVWLWGCLQRKNLGQVQRPR